MRKLFNPKGFSHHLLLPVLAVFIVAGIGVFTLSTSSAQAASTAPSCGSGYKLLKKKKSDDGKIVTMVYYKRTAKTASKPYKFTFCAYFKQTYNKKAIANRIIISGPDYKWNSSKETTGKYSKTAKLSVSKKKQCIGVSGVTKVWEEHWGVWDYYAHSIPTFSAVNKDVCSS
jgi:hypothetical protein